MTTVFVEPLLSPEIGETVAREAGAETAVLDPLEGLTEEELERGEDYLSVDARRTSRRCGRGSDAGDARRRARRGLLRVPAGTAGSGGRRPGGRRERVRGRRRAERRRQDDSDPPRARSGAAGCRLGAPLRRARAPLLPAGDARLRRPARPARRPGPDHRAGGRLRRASRAGRPARPAPRARPGHRRGGDGRRRARRAGRRAARPSSRAVSSSVRSSPRLSPGSPRCSSWTSRPPASTPARRSRSHGCSTASTASGT